MHLKYQKKKKNARTVVCDQKTRESVGTQKKGLKFEKRQKDQS